MFNRSGPEEQKFKTLRATPRPLEEQELTTERVFGKQDPIVHRPQIRLKQTIQATIGKLIFIIANENAHLHHRPIAVRNQVQYEIGTPGVLSYQAALPKEQRSNLNFDDDKGPKFEDTQKKKISHRKTNPNVKGRQSTIVLG